MSNNRLSLIWKGIIKENPTSRYVPYAGYHNKCNQRLGYGCCHYGGAYTVEHLHCDD